MALRTEEHDNDGKKGIFVCLGRARGGFLLDASGSPAGRNVGCAAGFPEPVYHSEDVGVMIAATHSAGEEIGTMSMDEAELPTAEAKVGFQSNLGLLIRRPGAFFWRYRWLVLLLLLATTADTLTTIRNMRLFGTGIEVHPAMFLMCEIFGIDWGVPLGSLARLMFVFGIASLIAKLTPYVLLTCSLLYSLAAMSNYFHWL